MDSYPNTTEINLSFNKVPNKVLFERKESVRSFEVLKNKPVDRETGVKQTFKN